MAVAASVCPHCGRDTEAVRGTCPNCGRSKDGGESVFAREEARTSARGGFDDWLSMAVWFVPGLALLIISVVFVESLALVLLAVGVLIAPAIIWYLLEESGGSWS
jgi:hypothetical protein